MLYIVSTPIGNLKDISLRAIEVLNLCDYILCEDTRVSKTLLIAYDIKTPLYSYHKYSEKSKLDRIITDLKNGKNIALISDAGTPLISDPGSILLKRAYEENVEVTAIPGASSVIDALVLSGFDLENFQFLGFLEKKPSDLKFQIKKMLFFDGTSICFESARRILKTVEMIKKIDPERNLAILKELTKKFEKRISMKSEDLYSYLLKNPVKGELVLLVEKGEVVDNTSIEDTIELLKQNFALSLKEAIKLASKLKNCNKRKVYEKFHK
ncbi:MAG: 16S rRNA (cytidine(1402)-2'-O)-methyltransferase [Parachlamydiales bacterium]|nr:16S rRNA (cytidine(1402)-2'-O)-methyltransferase [Parachlamydiales bacterium]